MELFMKALIELNFVVAKLLFSLLCYPAEIHQDVYQNLFDKYIAPLRIYQKYRSRVIDIYLAILENRRVYKKNVRENKAEDFGVRVLEAEYSPHTMVDVFDRVKDERWFHFIPGIHLYAEPDPKNSSIEEERVLEDVDDTFNWIYEPEYDIDDYTYYHFNHLFYDYEYEVGYRLRGHTHLKRGRGLRGFVKRFFGFK
jgi:hypothetical protein